MEEILDNKFTQIYNLNCADSLKKLNKLMYDLARDDKDYILETLGSGIFGWKTNNAFVELTILNKKKYWCML